MFNSNSIVVSVSDEAYVDVSIAINEHVHNHKHYGFRYATESRKYIEVKTKKSVKRVARILEKNLSKYEYKVIGNTIIVSVV